jgi:hypothetical protein
MTTHASMETATAATAAVLFELGALFLGEDLVDRGLGLLTNGAEGLAALFTGQLTQLLVTGEGRLEDGPEGLDLLVGQLQVRGHALEHPLRVRGTMAADAARAVVRAATAEAAPTLAHLVDAGELLGGQDPFELGAEALAELFLTGVPVLQNGAQKLDLIVGELEALLHVGEASFDTWVFAQVFTARGERRGGVTAFGGCGNVARAGAASGSRDGEQEGWEEVSGHVGVVLSERHWCLASERWAPHLTKV